MTIDIPMNVAPRGFPRCRSLACAWSEAVEATEEESGLEEERLVFRRKSWVIAMPIEAKERDVRSQARNVRSVFCIYSQSVSQSEQLLRSSVLIFQITGAWKQRKVGIVRTQS
jgi:hypothetical protein